MEVERKESGSAETSGFKECDGKECELTLGLMFEEGKLSERQA